MNKIKTPICDFVLDYAQKHAVRAHMPGHKGTGVLGVEYLDITEIPGADVLYHSAGIIRESEEIAAELFGTARTVYSCEGSSLSIRAMLYLVCLWAAEQGRTPKILAGRNAHKVFLSAAALLDMKVDWIWPTGGDYLSCDITPDRLAEILDACGTEKPAAVYVTSPDYLGNTVDIGAIARVCHSRDVLLLVDNAHGAYLHFLPEDRHPITHGADLCCDSAHKTLPAVTGAGYLQISRTAPAFFAEHAEEAMAMFASTSPSYLIMQSLDGINPYLAADCPADLSDCVRMLAAWKAELQSEGYVLLGDEPLKITVDCKARGYSGEDFAALLEKQGVFAEFADPDYLVLMLTPANSDYDLEKLRTAFRSIPRKTPIAHPVHEIPRPKQRLTPHEAIFAPSETIPAWESLGRILAGMTVSCPPAVPIVTCGEEICEASLALFRYYGIDHVSVVKR
ncbi:MAG: PLP-dependent transferase [Clostridia bacterium]|nr:PLP-dependent transferase [Clostridia bacterium]